MMDSMSPKTDNAASDDAIEYAVSLSNNALHVYLAISSSADAKAVDSMLGLLGFFPRLGHLYEPLYEAARMPFDLYVAYAGHYGIYYEISDDVRRVDVVFIEDQRRDPNNRFSDIQNFYG